MFPHVFYFQYLVHASITPLVLYNSWFSQSVFLPFSRTLTCIHTHSYIYMYVEQVFIECIMLGTLVNQINLIPPLWAYSLANIELIMLWILRDKGLYS